MLKHALIIGGTGMLRGVVQQLCQEGYIVSVIGRQQQKFNQLEKELLTPNGERHFYPVDYYRLTDFQETVQKLVQAHGPISICISWMRSDAMDSFNWLVSFLEQNKEVELYEIRGSHASQQAFQPIKTETFSWNRIILGFKIEKNGSRWLTNKEISAGVILAVKNKNNLHIVGTVEPWNRRPQ